jgi:hypothetical protein
MYEYSYKEQIRMLQLASEVHPNIQPRLVPSVSGGQTQLCLLHKGIREG